MKLAELGSTGIKVTNLAFGVMRLPEMTLGDKQVVDRDKAIPLLRQGVEKGINFFDTHPIYCRNESEIVLGEALEGIDKKIYIQTKCPLWKELKEGESWRDYLEKSLTDLRRDYIDLYIAHALNWETFREKGEGFLRMVRKAKEEGLVGHTGFSSHDKPENVMKILEVDEFECMTIQYNLVDRQYERCIEYAAKKGKGVIIMGPVAGGILERLPRRKEHVKPDRIETVPEMALRFVFRNPGVSCAMSGMENTRQLEENVKTSSTPDPLSDKDYKKLLEEFNQLKEMADLYCTRCEYCLPCPQKINIPGIFYAVNLLKVYDSKDQAEFFYKIFTQPDKEGNKRDPSACIECGECEEKCPQNIPIMEQLKEAKRLFEGE